MTKPYKQRVNPLPYSEWSLTDRVIEQLYRRTHGGRIRTLGGATLPNRFVFQDGQLHPLDEAGRQTGDPVHPGDALRGAVGDILADERQPSDTNVVHGEVLQSDLADRAPQAVEGSPNTDNTGEDPPEATQRSPTSPSRGDGGPGVALGTPENASPSSAGTGTNDDGRPQSVQDARDEARLARLMDTYSGGAQPRTSPEERPAIEDPKNILLSAGVDYDIADAATEDPAQPTDGLSAF